MNKPEITIVVPLYNCQKYLKETLESIAGQSFDRWVCLVIDDGSTDNSFRIAKHFCRSDRRFRVYRRASFSKVKGGNSCRNIGLKLAKTSWIMFVDADDLLIEQCLENRVNVLNLSSKYHFYVFKTAFINDDRKIKGGFYNPNQNLHDIILRLLKHKIPWHTMSPVWRLEYLIAIGGWNEEYERLQDVELHLRALIHRPDIYFQLGNDFDSCYRLNQMTDLKTKNARYGFCRLVKDYYEKLTSRSYPSKEYRVKFSKIFQNLLESLLIQYLTKNKEKDVHWERLYLNTLTALKVDKDEVKTIKRIFDNQTC